MGEQPPTPSVPGYDILAFVGRGGQGDVYQARHIGLDRTVALKVLRDSHESGRDQWARFRREARVIARLDHAHIVRVYGFDESGGRLSLSMEYLAGGSLRDRLGVRGPFALEDAVKLLMTLANAVQHAHDKGIVHRDLKPGNVLFTEEGHAKIVDFGLAKVLDDTTSHQTRSGAVLGSPSYMAPEQAAGKISQVGPGTDVYALGAILYELLTARPPFAGESWLETLDRVRFQPAVPPSHWRSDVPHDLEQICLKCLEKSPELRFSSAAELATALEQFATASKNPSATQPPTVNSPRRSARRPVVEQPTGGDPPTSENAPAKGKLVGTQHHGGYQLVHQIRAGAFGEIWSAVAPGGIKAAVKILYRPVDAEAPEMRALDLIKNLNHAYLLKVQAWWVEDRRLHVAMELADGSLRSRLRKGRPRGEAALPTAGLLACVREVAEALDYLHDHGLIHRNITPDNILLVQGHAKVGDFSLVCDGTTPGDASAGAVGYLAPECFRGHVTPQSDQYSLAITYVELRRGRRPFPARTTLAQAMLDAFEASPDLGEFDKAEKKVLLKALAKEPAERYPTCRAFAAALGTAVPRGFAK
jgi:serine/threonine protein kinase